jgi:exopolyphosphatase/guanosine-5'-triphosphate,3'-diphosphate pyrophosphatase
MERVHRVLDGYREQIDGHGAGDAAVAVMTSAVRDAENGAEFAAEVATRYGLDARTLTGDEEARLTFRGATGRRDPEDPTPTLVIDIGGGSTELVVGRGGCPEFHVSLQAGVVRHTERHLASDPPTARERTELADDVRDALAAAVPGADRLSARVAIAVAGTATSLAAIAQELEPYDPGRVHGYVLARGDCELILARLAAMPLAERRKVPGLHPDRAPTIVAGVAILLEGLRAFGLEEIEVSEHDILWGAALTAARDAGA